MKSHASKTVECPGCSRFFSSHSAMVLHLEAGICESAVDSDRVREIALDCHDCILYTHDDDPEFDFECPMCSIPFKYMSALLQHDECSPATCREWELWSAHAREYTTEKFHAIPHGTAWWRLVVSAHLVGKNGKSTHKYLAPCRRGICLPR